MDVTVLGAGSSLIGGTLKTEILREEVLELALDGFLPGCELSIEWRERDDHVLMTGPATFEHEGRFDPALFASVA